MATAFSKWGLRKRQAHCNIASFWQPSVTKWFASASIALRLQYTPWCHNPSDLGVVNTAAKQHFASAQRFSRKGNGGEHWSVDLLENLIPIRIF
jgi:hypothetical protein